MIYMVNTANITDEQRQEIRKVFDASPGVKDWMRIMPCSWFVEAPEMAMDDLRKLVHRGAPDISLLVTRFYTNSYNGWLPKECWEWVKKKSLPAPPRKPDGNPADTSRDGQRAALMPVTSARALDDYIGIDDAAAQLRRLTGRASFRTAAARAGLKLDDGFANILFIGPPGTGKTSLAKTAAQMLLESRGSDKKQKISIVQAADLVDRHVGKSMDNTKAVLDEAGEGVLVFDEIDTLLQVSYYGAEVLNALNTHMGHAPNKPVIIATLYGQNEQAFRTANPGLSSRFPHVVRMSGYNDVTLARIFNARAEAAGLKVEHAAEPVLRQLIASVRGPAGKNFGNARAVDNIFDAVLDNIAARFEELPDELRTADAEANPENFSAMCAAISVVTAADIPVRDPETGVLVRRAPPGGRPSGGGAGPLRIVKPPSAS